MYLNVSPGDYKSCRWTAELIGGLNWKGKVFVSGRVRLWTSRVRTRAQCFQPGSWLVEVYCKASSYPLKRDYSPEFFFSPRTYQRVYRVEFPQGFTREGGIERVWWQQKIRLLTFTLHCFWWQRRSLCCSCSHHLKLIPPPTITETWNYADAL